MNKKILFHHIPKTAGTTLISFLDQQYNHDEVLPDNYFEKPERDLTSIDIDNRLEDIINFSYIRGHYPVSCFDSISQDYSRICLLRNPLTRLFSLFNDWKTKSMESLIGAHPADIQIAKFAREMSISDFLHQEQHPIPALFDNGQTRLLCNKINSERLSLEDLNAAKANLDKMELVGITETFNSFLRLLCQKFNLHFPNQFESLNRRQYKYDNFDELHNEIIFNYIKYDLLLYEYALQLWDNYSKELKGDSSSGTNQGIIIPQKKDISFSMLDGFTSSGFHTREGLGGEHVWRWTGPGKESTVEVNLDPTFDYEITLAIISVMDQKILDNLTLAMNNNQLPSRLVGLWEGQQIIRATIAKKYLNQDANDVLKLIVPYTIAHSELDSKVDDNRQKGIAVTLIEINSIS